MPQKFPVARAEDIPAGGMKPYKVNGKSIVVAHAGGTFYAVENRCPHLGLPLSAGKVEGTNITCPFHGSKFDLITGENMDWVMGIGSTKLPDWSRAILAMGRRPTPVKLFRVVKEENQLYVEME
jgi:nitrite reductase/ring-hydroxylating ferredoxin subunit